MGNALRLKSFPVALPSLYPFLSTSIYPSLYRRADLPLHLTQHASFAPRRGALAPLPGGIGASGVDRCYLGDVAMPADL